MDSLGSPSRDGFVRQPVYIPLDASKQEINIHNFLSTQNVFQVDVKETLSEMNSTGIRV